jgi:hypothetical protein
VFLVAARHVDSITALTRYAAIEPVLTSPLIRLGGQELREARWSDPVDACQRPLPPAPTCELIPLYTCHLTPDDATFHLVTIYRHKTAYLVEAWHTRPPADLKPYEAPAWAQRTHDEQATVNIGPPRLGQRLTQQVEIEAKLTLRQQHDPLALALTISNMLGNRDAGLTHRILRSHLYEPAAANGYAAFTARPDGGWWAKAKHAAAPGSEMRREQHCVVHDLDAGLAWASAALDGDLHLVGRMHRTCWDQVTGPDPKGEMCTITADRTRMGPHTLHQIEIEYSARLAQNAPNVSDAQRHVDDTAKVLARALNEAGITVDRGSLTKLDFFRGAGALDAR